MSDKLLIYLLRRELIKKTDSLDVKKDCIFYEDVQDMQATFQHCKFTGDLYKKAICKNCIYYFPEEIALEFARQALDDIYKNNY